MKLITFLILIVFFSSCQQTGIKNEQVIITNNDTATSVNSSLKENKVNKGLICPKADSIALIFNRFIHEKDLDNINAQSFYIMLRQNDLDESNCHFPRNNAEIDLFNRFTNELLKNAELYDKAILLLLYIFDTSRRNVELIEFLQSKLASLFIYYTDSYIDVIVSLDDEKRNRAIGVVEFINNKEDLKNLKIKISQYKAGNKARIINDIEKIIDEEINR